MKYFLTGAVFVCLVFQSCDDEQQPGLLSLLSARIGAINLTSNQVPNEISIDQPIVLTFSSPVASGTVDTSISLTGAQQNVPLTFSFSNDHKIVTIRPFELLTNTEYKLVITDQLMGLGGEPFQGINFSFRTAPGLLKVLQWTLGGETPTSHPIADVPLNIDLSIQFDTPLLAESVNAGSVIITGPSIASLLFDISSDGTKLTITSGEVLSDLGKYKLVINNQLKGEQDETFTRFEIDFYTTKDTNPDFLIISDDELLTLVQQQTFKYFWDFAHASSGMARERNTSGNVVTSGGSGFGIMALIVGMERNFISRADGLDRMKKILTFLEGADRFHGAWPHWMDGNTGNVIPFSANDNGGDLVETSFLIQGLLTFRQYLDAGNATEKTLVDRINALWHTVEWDWYTRGGQNVLYWHWSPDKQWTMNHAIRGYNEALITYFLAAGSPTHSVNASVYHEGWTDNGAFRNNKSFFNIPLPLGDDYGGPLFFTHYSFLGLDPRNLKDAYAEYWTQNVNHTQINHAYSVANPKNFVGYSDENWGLTASDNHQGYSAHSPTNDLGVITPSAALSSFPYTPDESMKALRFFYYTLGDRLWGPYGFYDAFNLTEGWTADSYLAIDQGPIIVMIENHRTGLLWDLFMSSPEVTVAMDKLGFTR
ncbi:MAG TPA: glucoamylase family protein [Chryseosolibacter sp.]